MTAPDAPEPQARWRCQGCGEWVEKPEHFHVFVGTGMDGEPVPQQCGPVVLERDDTAELVEALERLYDLADSFNVEGVYFSEDVFVENVEALKAAETALAKWKERRDE